MLPERLVFIDVETTGARLAHDRITEIGLLQVEYGQVTAQWQSLINPGQPIPENIQTLTGITDTMVTDAPRFPAIASTLLTLMKKCVFVAHNVLFDYGFIKKELSLAGFDLDMPALCTVKLSRALYPAHHRHGLDVLIERHNLCCTARHRAMGDAEALWQFFTLIKQDFPPDILLAAIQQAMLPPSRPARLPETLLAGIPESPGAYLFFNTSAHPGRHHPDHFKNPLYIGSTSNLRSQIINHCTPSKQKGEAQTLANQLRHVEWIETTGKLEAQLLAARLKALYPPHLPRTKAHHPAAPFALRPLPHRRHPPLFAHIPLEGTNPLTWNGLYGIFSTPEEADSLLAEIARNAQLCLCRLGLTHSARGKTCQEAQTPRCPDGYPSSTTLPEYDARLLNALESATSRMRWPWQGPVLFQEHNLQTRHSICHLFDHWCHLGSAPMPDAVHTEYAHMPRVFRLDTYRILARWFSHPEHRAAVTPLQ